MIRPLINEKRKGLTELETIPSMARRNRELNFHFVSPAKRSFASKVTSFFLTYLPTCISLLCNVQILLIV